MSLAQTFLPSFKLLFVILLLFASCVPSQCKNQTKQVSIQMNGDGYGGAGSVIKELSPEQPCTVIVLHGLGGNGKEWAYLFMPVSFLSLTYVRFILPSAESHFVNYRNRTEPSWFNVNTISGGSSKSEIVVNRDDLMASVRRIDRIIDGEIRRGVQPSRIILMGFSQGGALAQTVFLRSKESLGGCVGVATWLPFHEDYPAQFSNALTSNPMILFHGEKDDAVKYSLALAGVNHLRRLNQPVKFVPFPNGTHKLVEIDVVNQIEDYIKNQAPGRAEMINDLVSDIANFFNSLTGGNKPKLS